MNLIINYSFYLAWPYALLILVGAIILAYAALKWYDEPVHKWRRGKLG